MEEAGAAGQVPGQTHIGIMRAAGVAEGRDPTSTQNDIGM